MSEHLLDRAVLLATLFLGVGLPLLAFALAKLARAVHYRFQWGKPYVPGSIARATRVALAALLITGFGMGLGLTRWLLRDYQALRQPAIVAEIRVLDRGSGYVLEMKTEPIAGHPRLVAVGLPGETWQIRGTVVTFPTWAGPTGLTAFQIVETVAEPNGAVLARLGHGRSAVDLLSRLPAWLDIKVTPLDLNGRGAVPDWTPVAADTGGYFLALDIPSSGDAHP